MRALFVCNASRSIGFGHVMRCLAIADALYEKGWRCDFFCTSETTKIVKALSQSPHGTLHDKAMIEGPYHIIIIDSYNLDEVEEKKFRSLGDNIAVIDDLANRKHDCDILIDLTLDRREKDYQGLVPDNCKVLTGVDYALLRPEFNRLKNQALMRRNKAQGKIETVLISMGGTDPHNITSKVLNALNVIKEPLTIDVVISSQSPVKEEIEAGCAKLRVMGMIVALHLDVSDMAGMMMRADLAVGAAGVSSWERCCLGLPTLMIKTAENQQYVVSALHKAGAAEYLGSVAEVSEKNISLKLKSYLENSQKTYEMGIKASDLVDGKGISRIIPYISGIQGNDVHLRLMNKLDMKILFNWQEHELTRQYARNKSIPSWQEHEAWFLKTISDASKQLYMIMYDQQEVGMVRLDRRDESSDIAQSYEVSILLDPDFYGQGIAADALCLIRKIEPKAEIWAEILPENKASRKLFGSLGYQPITKTWFMQQGNEER